MKTLSLISRYFPIWVICVSILSIYNPKIFIWFTDDMITYGLAGIMLGMGLTLKFNDFIQIIRMPHWILIGLFLQFTVMPMLGWSLAFFFDLPKFFAVGLILVSCCPGGTASNVIVYLSKTNLPLSVSMTTISTLSAIIMTPILTSIYSGTYLEVDSLGLFLSTTKVVLIPIFVGILFNIFLPRLTNKITPFSPSAAVILICLIVGSIIGQGKEIILNSGMNLFYSIIILHFFGFIFGYIFCYLITKNKFVSKTISIEVGMQNSGLGVVLARDNFVNPSTAIPSAISSLVHSVMGSLFVVLFKEKNIKVK